MSICVVLSTSVDFDLDIKKSMECVAQETDIMSLGLLCLLKKERRSSLRKRDKEIQWKRGKERLNEVYGVSRKSWKYYINVNILMWQRPNITVPSVE
jgi:hypothetical protein